MSCKALVAKLSDCSYLLSFTIIINVPKKELSGIDIEKLHDKASITMM